jgi:hypothetical protein
VVVHSVAKRWPPGFVEVYATFFANKLVKALEGNPIDVLNDGKSEPIRLAQIDAEVFSVRIDSLLRQCPIL